MYFLTVVVVVVVVVIVVIVVVVVGCCCWLSLLLLLFVVVVMPWHGRKTAKTGQGPQTSRRAVFRTCVLYHFAQFHSHHLH